MRSKIWGDDQKYLHYASINSRNKTSKFYGTFYVQTSFLFSCRANAVEHLNIVTNGNIGWELVKMMS